MSLKEDMDRLIYQTNVSIDMIKELISLHTSDELLLDAQTSRAYKYFGAGLIGPNYAHDLFSTAADLDNPELMDIVSNYLGFSNEDIKDINFGTASGDGDILLFAVADEKYEILNWLIEKRRMYDIADLMEIVYDPSDSDDDPEHFGEIIMNARLNVSGPAIAQLIGSE